MKWSLTGSSVLLIYSLEFPFCFILQCLFWRLTCSLQSPNFYRILLMKCVQCCLGKNMPQWFFFIFKVCLIPSTSCRPFFTKESDYQVWLKWFFLYMGNCFSQLWIWQARFPKYQCNTWSCKDTIITRLFIYYCSIQTVYSERN